MVVVRKPSLVLSFGPKLNNKLWLSCAKLKLSCVEVKVKVVVKVGKKVVVEAGVQLLVRWVGGWSYKTKLILNSAIN